MKYVNDATSIMFLVLMICAIAAFCRVFLFPRKNP